ncbi:Pre-mRNA splicing factor-domain-containing protein [Chytridium lagenaria]|nr:Pre-mRNA splicing factor-domain-containing protein [Chytridium lagenaria]
MGGGDLNLKKSWHPGTLKNVEKVYLKERAADEEKKKLAQLQKEIEEQRAVQELQQLQESSGKIKKRQERLDWMYAGPGSVAQVAEDREAYLLGKKKVDKLIEQGKSVDELSSKNTFSATATAIYGAQANTSRDIQNKIREDPLLSIKKREQSSLQAVLNNPLRVKAIKEAAESKKEKKKKEKKDKKDKRKKKHSSSDDERGRKEDNEHKRKRSRSTSSDWQEVTVDTHIALTDSRKSVLDSPPTSGSDSKKTRDWDLERDHKRRKEDERQSSRRDESSRMIDERMMTEFDVGAGHDRGQGTVDGALMIVWTQGEEILRILTGPKKHGLAVVAVQDHGLL